MSKQTVIGAVVLVAIVGVIGVLEVSKPTQSRIPAQDIVLDNNIRTAEKEKKYERAKEITTPDGFINTDPLTISEHIGKKVILVDFWTYSCINCQRTLPYLRSWDEKYRDEGLLIIGLHTPEFEFEKEYDNVVRATEKWEVEYPVVLDNDYSTWRAYKNRYWPRKYLIDIDGFIVYDHIGEGAYDETEKKIVELLNERNRVLGEGQTVAVKEVELPDVQEVDFGQVRTHETYLGSARVEYLRNAPTALCLTQSCDYAFTDNLVDGYELSGKWRTESEFVTLESETGALRIAFTASKVNLVAGAADGTTVNANILIDGELVDTVTFTDEHDLYNLVDLEGRYESYILEIQFLDNDIDLFAFTFG